MDTVLKIFEPVIEYVRDHGINQVIYIFHYTKNIEELNKTVKRLGEVKESLDSQCDEAKRKGHIVKPRVEEWFGEVGEFENRVENYRKNAGHKKTRGLYYFLPYYRHKLGRKAKKMEVEALKLTNESPKVDEVSHAEKISSFDITSSNSGYIEFNSRKSIMEDIMTKLKDPNMKIIGLHGSQGMGKSTFIKKVANKAKDEGLFERVVEIDVTISPNPLKIQEEIAYVLNLPLAGESENVRADYLRRWLKFKNVSILIILNDVHERLDLNRLGIPVENDYDLRKTNELSIRSRQDTRASKQDTADNTRGTDEKVPKKTNFLGNYKGYKVLLSSCDKKVFPDEVDAESSFCLKELDDSDALMLFEKVTGGCNKMSMPKEEIQNYCKGLPMRIVKFAMAYKNWSESESEPTLDKFKKQGLVEWKKSSDIPNKIKYDLPKNKELKFIFLLCAQMGHLPLVNDLVKYCFGLGIFEGVSSLSAAREKINEAIQELKNLSLVSFESPNIHFSMSHMVRDDALSNALTDNNVFAFRDGELDYWPNLEKCISISICNSDIIDRFPQVINCPQLNFLQIETNNPSLEIPDIFFSSMKNLLVLILTGFHLSSLPYSIEDLLNLRMLCLERCTLDCNLSILRKFKKLRILSFSGSQLKKLPFELRFLDKLRLLDISDCFELKIIPSNLLSSLTCLEELYISKSLIKMLVETDTNKGQNSFLSELTNLHQLKVVDISIPCVSCIPNQLIFDKLTYYKIEIGEFEMISVGEFWMSNKYEELKVLALQLKNDTDIRSKEGIMLLLKTADRLMLGEASVQSVVNDLNMDGFLNLKHLSIINNKDIKYVNSTKLSNCGNVFPNLEYICLYNMMNLKMICYGEVTVTSFAKLKTIKVKMCYRLENLFSFYTIKISTCGEETSEISDCNSYMNEFLASLEMIEVCECESLKEILRIPVNYDKVEFLMLRTLTLQSLPSLTCFSTKVESSRESNLTQAQTTNRGHTEISTEEDDHSDMAPPLFGELVEVPNLENLNLSSLNIHKIWSNQHSSSVCFQNLIKLVVKDCDKLTHLCSLPMASHLKKLKSLVISGCPIMEKIFETEGISAENVYVFPKLEEIHLSKMNGLIDIWQTKVSADSFSNLIFVRIEECNQLNKIFPSQMQGWFESLINLEVSECKSVIEIFEINDSHEINASGIDTNLQVILLEGLPKLKQLWSKDPDGILNFKKLQSIDVRNCDELTNLFPTSVAKDVSKLERMSVFYCKKMVEIVASKDAAEDMKDPLKFPELTYVRLYGLSNMKQFYEGRHPIKCPKLKELSIDKCVKLQTFLQQKSETRNEENFIFSAEEVFPNLEYMEIHYEAQKLLSKYQMQCLKELIILRAVNSPDLLYSFMYRMPNLEKLKLTFPQYARKSVKSSNIEPQELGTVLKLKQLYVYFSDITDLGFERYQVLQRLELLRLKGCHNLNTLAPSSVMLTYLTCLKLKNCNGLKNLMASSTAKSMVQLKTMKVIKCDKIEQIISMEESEEGKEMKIVFGKLISIELLGLKKLASFCRHKECEFEFSSLEMFIVRGCPKMEKFSEKRSIAPKLKNIFGVKGNEKSKWQWEGHLNATIQKVFNDKVSFAYTEILWLDDNIKKQLWDDTQVQQNSFGYLKRLWVWDCHTLKHIIPSHLLSCFHNLEELNVHHCSNAEVIFNMNDENRVMTKPSGIFRLKILSLDSLPQLKHVWDKDPEGVMGLQLLKEMRVENCKSLKSLFPASVVKDLTRLEVLEVTNCKKLVEIFWKDEKGGEGETTTQEFVFRDLTSLTPKELPALKYSIHCSKQQCMTVGENGMKMILRGEFERNLLASLKTLTLCFGSDVFPCKILEVVPNIEKLVVCYGSFKKMFCCESGNNVLQRLKVLRLKFLGELVSIGLENSWTDSLVRNLEIFEVVRCKSLKNLVGCTVSFSNLRCLKVEECHSLSYLLTSSAAKRLGQLKRMEISFCLSIEEIVYKEDGEESDEDEIIFPQLTCLNLDTLYELKRFYRGSLGFPSLEELSVTRCDEMITLCEGSIEAGKLSQVIDKLSQFIDKYSDAIQLETELNSTMRKEYLTKEWKKSLELRDRADLQEIWRLSLQISDFCFTYLETLIVNKCKISSDAVLPFTLLSLLPKLETLEVHNCDSVKTIFDVNSSTQVTVTLSLKKLVLRKLPNLETVCSEVTEANPAHPDGTNPTLRFPSMTSLALCDLPNFKHNTIYFIHDDAAPTFELIIPNLEHLTVGKNELKMIVNGEFQRNLLHKLKVLGLCFDIECDEFPEYGFLQKLPNVMKLVVCDSSFKVIFCDQIPNNSEILLRLKELRLESLQELVSIGLENSWTEPFVRNLETFEVIKCSNLKNLVTCRVSFSNLIRLKVENCDSLSYLFTSSTAKSLGNLQRMEIQVCESIEEIVSKEGKESDEDEIIFPKLNCLSLQYLKNLLRFYKGSLSFPFLEELSIRRCDEMVTLCLGTLEASKLSQVTLEGSNTRLETGLNSTMKKEFLRKISKLDKLDLESRPGLQEIWNGSDLCFSKLAKLTVNDCQFLSDAVLPFHLLPSLPKLEILEVRNCNYVKVIFDVKRTTKDTSITFRLEKLVLSNLPNVENVWNEDPRGILSMHHLEHVFVDKCKCLKRVFPASVARDLENLEDLVVEDCEGLMAIVADESHENEEIIFKRLQVLDLKRLKQLTCFCAGNFTLNFPSLEEVHVIKCCSMKTFSGVTKIGNPTRWYYSEYARPRKETDLNSALHKTCEEEAPDASTSINVSVLQY
ncbi:uncharacterized protein LOC108346442 isoform X2 [Vigna angularis]|uniref:uncharacterized protein LOC108346442 isoform X2 n=1 Tax=Phaseolus angularis TaxID=3914 RepID=UPI0022B335A3|nr:uncharacterized protein LOC108346442 isoform X2 [Vigna angularis]